MAPEQGTAVVDVDVPLVRSAADMRDSGRAEPRDRVATRPLRADRGYPRGTLRPSTRGARAGQPTGALRPEPTRFAAYTATSSTHHAGVAPYWARGGCACPFDTYADQVAALITTTPCLSARRATASSRVSSAAARGGERS